MLKKLPNKELTLSSKIPLTTEEQYQYYLDLFKKWEKQKSDEKLKVENPEFWEALQEIDFNYYLVYIRGVDFIHILDKYSDKLKSSTPEVQLVYLTLACYDDSLREINCFVQEDIGMFFEFIKDFRENFTLKIKKKILVYPNGFEYNNLKLINLEGDFSLGLNFSSSFQNSTELEFKDCNFDTITLENFDRGYFYPETNDYLNEMERQGKLNLINCIWSGLPQTLAIRENYEATETGKKIWEKEIVLDEKTKPLKTLLHKHLAFFSDFVELTEGKKVQIRITSQESIILIEIFSFNGATAELIEKKYYEYVDYTLSSENSFSKFNFSDKISLLARIQAEGEIGYQKGMFAAQKERIEELRQDKIRDFELLQTLAKKLPDQNKSSPSLVFNIENHGTINLAKNSKIIEQKIGQIINDNSHNKELKNLFEEINSLKDQILASNELDDETKQESLEYIEEIADNIEQKDNPDKLKILKKAGRGLLNIVTPIVQEVASGLIKKQLGL